MKKNINIIVKKNIASLGKKGDMKTVALGYALNYLIPNKMAEIATKGKIKHINMFKNIEQQKIQQNQYKAEKLKKDLDQITKISIKKKMGEQHQIFGSVTDKEILKLIFEYTGKQFEKKQLNIHDIKKSGLYFINIQILDNIQTQLKLHVVPEDI
uniref:50S ribosomal protein L9, chloroplastic n=1 Tax=Schimmelmannia schousboei TaxID=173468 RepID=A0A1C9C905_9FLOR|nr:ribosomal protein L9 [Schimmelmannia schousboei]AOM64839.1 ribosomal protein L9 [Schimmelmannia schousboei]